MINHNAFMNQYPFSIQHVSLSICIFEVAEALKVLKINLFFHKMFAKTSEIKNLDKFYPLISFNNSPNEPKTSVFSHHKLAFEPGKNLPKSSSKKYRPHMLRHITLGSRAQAINHFHAK